MKIKHFQGYGTVEAKKISKITVDNKTTLVIKVKGNHECGIIREDVYDVSNWLIKKFDKKFTNYKNIISMHIEPGYEDNTDTAIYKIVYYDDDR